MEPQADSFEAGLNKLNALRETASVEDKQEGEVQDVSTDDALPIESAEVVETEVEEVDELENLEDEGQPEEEGSEESQLVYEIEGAETTLAEILEWKAGHMKDADYRRKTQGVAEEKKATAKEREANKEMQETLQSHIDLMSEVIDAEYDGIDWDELRDTDTAEYLKLKERKEGKQGKLKGAKAKRDS